MSRSDRPVSSEIRTPVPYRTSRIAWSRRATASTPATAPSNNMTSSSRSALGRPRETSLLEVLSQTDSLSQSGSLTVFRRISTPGEQGVNHNDVQAIHVDLQALLQQGNMSKNLLLQAQDVVYIPKPDAVFVFGEVAKTGPIPLPEGGMSLVETINKAGGFSKFAASKRTRVLRMVEGQETIIYVDMAAIIRGDLGKDIRLRSNDIVIVPEAVF